MDQQNSLNFKQFIINWNLQYPYDRFWRQKYNVAFGSPKHRAMNFVDMVLDLLEEKIVKETTDEMADLLDKDERDYFNSQLPGENRNQQNQENKVVKKVTKKELEEDFENLDLTQFND